MLEIFKNVFNNGFYVFMLKKDEWLQILMIFLIIIAPLLVITVFINIFMWILIFITWNPEFLYYIPFITETHESIHVLERILIVFGILLAINDKF